MGDCNSRFLAAGKEALLQCDRSKCTLAQELACDASGSAQCALSCMTAQCDWSKHCCSAVKAELEKCPVFDALVLESVELFADQVSFVEGGSVDGYGRCPSYACDETAASTVPAFGARPCEKASLPAKEPDQYVFCQYQMFSDDLCTIPTTQNSHLANPGIGFETIAYPEASKPHNLCLSDVKYGFVRSHYINVTGAYLRSVGTVHSTRDCSDVGIAFNQRADGTTCETVYNLSGTAQARRIKILCTAEPGASYKMHGFSDTSCSSDEMTWGSGITEVPRSISGSSNNICLSCGPGCSYRGLHCSTLNLFEGVYFASDDCTGNPWEVREPSGTCHQLHQGSWQRSCENGK
jgi:hypothetical protein